VLLKLLLDYLNAPDPSSSPRGWLLVLALALTQLVRNMFFMLCLSVSMHTAMRVHGATQFLGMAKLLRLSAPSDAALGQLVTFVTGDQERMQEAVVGGILFIGRLPSSVLCIVWVLSPHTPYCIGNSIAPSLTNFNADFC
jgi:hypothetical protein